MCDEWRGNIKKIWVKTVNESQDVPTHARRLLWQSCGKNTHLCYSPLGMIKRRVIKASVDFWNTSETLWREEKTFQRGVKKKKLQLSEALS